LKEPVFEQLKYQAEEQTLSDKLKTEVKTDINPDDVKVIDVASFVAVTEKDVSDGKIKYGGKTIFYLIYTENDEIRKKEYKTDFVGIFSDENIKENSRVRICARSEKTSYDASSGVITLTAEISVTAKIVNQKEVLAVSDCEGLVFDKKEKEIVKSSGYKTTVYPLDEEFELNYSVTEVLSQNVSAAVTAVQCGVGSIIVDGECVWTAEMLQNIEKSDIIKENKIIPFRVEIECEEAMPTMDAVASVRENSFKADVSVDGETGRSAVGFSAVLVFEGEAFYKENALLINDAFSTTEEVETVADYYEAYKPCPPVSVTENVSGRVNIGEIAAGTRVMATGCGRTEIVSAEIADGKLNVTGIFSVPVYLRDNEGKVYSVTAELPFTSVTDTVCEGKAEVCAAVTDCNVKIISVTDAEVSATIVMTVYTGRTERVRYVKNIECHGEKQRETCPISVYLSTQGEELWSLSKRLNVCPDELIATNKDLQFPLTGKERIVIYRQN